MAKLALLKYESIERLNNKMGLRHWGQTVTDWAKSRCRWSRPRQHNPALVVDWCRFCSDTIVAFVRMQADILREVTPNAPVTTNLRALRHRFDHFDLADVIDFVSIESTSAIKPKSADLACEIDMFAVVEENRRARARWRQRFWVMEQKAGNVSGRR